MTTQPGEAPSETRTGPLAGYRVLDVTNVLAGPYCGHLLAHLGADVIKVETPGAGDLARNLGADRDLNARGMGISFLAQNAGKRSIAINLKSDRGRAIFRRLATGADVVVENFRPGVMARLGVGADVLGADNPDLIYCAISGFGQSGPLSQMPAYDQIVQGMSGVMSITGGDGSAPNRVGYPMADTIGGLMAAFAISAALAKPSNGGNRGCVIDVSMLESVMATMGWVVSNHLMAGSPAVPQGNNNPTASPSGTFRTASQPINIAANKQEQFEALARVLGLSDIITDDRFRDRHARLDNRETLTRVLEEALTRRPADYWVEALPAVGVPCGPVLTVPQALSLDQLVDRSLVQTVGAVDRAGADGSQPVQITRPGFLIDQRAPSVDRPPPTLGQDTDGILREIGMTDGDIEVARAEGAVA